MFTQLQQSFLSKAVRMSVVAWLLIFVCSQVSAASHIHVDNSFDEPCSVCIHSDHTPAADSPEATHVSLGIARSFSASPILAPAPSKPFALYLSRAPPFA